MFFVYGDNLVKIELPSKTLKNALRWATKNGFCELESETGEQWIDIAGSGNTWFKM